MAKYEKLFYINEREESIEFSNRSMFHTNGATGISDVRNAIYSINSMGQDGDTYLGNRIEARDIEITGSIATKDKEEMRVMRRRLNHVLNPQFNARLLYQWGDFVRVIDCKVDNAPVFPAKESIFQSFTIQLRCMNPFWREENEMREDIASWDSGFEFILPDGLEIPNDGTWEIGSRQPSLIMNVYNGGDVRSGMRIEFRAIGNVSQPELLNVDTQGYLKIKMELQAGDVLTVRTGYGEKAVTLLRGGEETNAFRYFDTEGEFLQLEVGDNLFRYDAASGIDNLEVSIYHNNIYLGV